MIQYTGFYHVTNQVRTLTLLDIFFNQNKDLSQIYFLWNIQEKEHGFYI